ncbi:hypothetical protein Fmac_008017 [Flemingia macrophylla]|uniref:Uncharacterized protein n=1 Tax=Flemingia macrophylla TaxID=520843 RepID=A0ABD1MW76_9FABA
MRFRQRLDVVGVWDCFAGAHASLENYYQGTRVCISQLLQIASCMSCMDCATENANNFFLLTTCVKKSIL